MNTKSESFDLTRELMQILNEELGLHDQFAMQLAEPIANGIRKRFSSNTIYIPKTSAAEIATRNESIKKEFYGCSEMTMARKIESVMLKYSVSRATIYRILGKK